MTTKNYTIYKMEKKTNCKKIPRIFFAQCVNFNKFGIWNGGKQKLERERKSPSVVYERDTVVFANPSPHPPPTRTRYALTLTHTHIRLSTLTITTPPLPKPLVPHLPTNWHPKT